MAGTRFSVPIPQADVPISEYKDKFSGTLTFIKVDSATGRMAIAFQILMPGFDYDLSHSGKGPSHGWSFFTSYNSEQANTLLEKNASQRDKDFIAAINWKQAEKCVADGKAVVTPGRYYHNVMGENQVATSEVLTSTKVLTPADLPGHGLLPADAEVAARRGREPERRVHRRRRQARLGDPGALVREDA